MNEDYELIADVSDDELVEMYNNFPPVEGMPDHVTSVEEIIER